MRARVLSPLQVLPPSFSLHPVAFLSPSSPPLLFHPPLILFDIPLSHDSVGVCVHVFFSVCDLAADLIVPLLRAHCL